ncbi:MAG: ABC-F family ATP-binding cassette domain-containing protein [Bacteroidales bacterium]
MISINSLSVLFGGEPLFSNLNFHISESDRIGLVGKNGSGKSTLLKIIAGVMEPSSGGVGISSERSVGYLPQLIEYRVEESIMEAALSSFKSLLSLERELERVNLELSKVEEWSSAKQMKLIERLHHLTERHSFLQSFNPEAECERVLVGLGFNREEFEHSRKKFSSGWNMRVELAKVLLANPDILLLDEPTNYLDIESIGWLESYLSNFKGATVTVSHDVRFLDNSTNRTVELVAGTLFDYKVSYSKFKELREERVEQQQAALYNQEQKIKSTERFIERFRYKASKASQVQSRIKQLERLERIEVDIREKAKIEARFFSTPKSGRVVLNASQLSFSYGEKPIFSNLNLTLERGDKVAIIGKNGAGKSTLMKLIAGELSPLKGELTLGHNVMVGYYSQNQDELLTKEDTIFESVDKIAVGEVRTKLRDILGAFLFSGDDVEKRVEVLSGGERARLALAKLIVTPNNFLLLDEPTNHMDISSKEALKRSFKEYPGTLLIISHDRQFLDGLVDRIYQFRGGELKEFKGEWIVEEERRATPGQPTQNRSEEISDSYIDREVMKEERRVKAKITKCEESIQEIESRIGEIEHLLSTPTPQMELEPLLKEYEKINSELHLRMEEWEELHSKL